MSFVGTGAFSFISTIFPSSIQIISRGNVISLIQNVAIFFSPRTKYIPEFSSRDLRPERPWISDSFVSATSTIILVSPILKVTSFLSSCESVYFSEFREKITMRPKTKAVRAKIILPVSIGLSLRKTLVSIYNNLNTFSTREILLFIYKKLILLLCVSG